MGAKCSKPKAVAPEKQVSDHSTSQQKSSFDLINDGLVYIQGEDYLRGESIDELIAINLPQGIPQALNYIKHLYEDQSVNLLDKHVKGLLKGLDYLIKHGDDQKWLQSLKPPEDQAFQRDLVRYLELAEHSLRALLAEKSDHIQSQYIHGQSTISPSKRLQHHSRPHACEVRWRVMTQLDQLLPKFLTDNVYFRKIVSMAIEFHDIEQIKTTFKQNKYDSVEQTSVARIIDEVKSKTNDLDVLHQSGNDNAIKEWMEDYYEVCQFILDHIIELGTTPINTPPLDPDKQHMYDIGGRFLEMLYQVPELKAYYKDKIGSESFLGSVYLSMGIMGIGDKFPAALPRILNAEFESLMPKNLYPKQDVKNYPLWKNWFDKWFEPYLNAEEISNKALSNMINQHIFFSIMANNIAMAVELVDLKTSMLSNDDPKAIELKLYANHLMGGIENRRCTLQTQDDMTECLIKLLFNNNDIPNEADFANKQITNLTNSQMVLNQLLGDFLQRAQSMRLALDICPQVAEVHKSNLIKLNDYINDLNKDEQSVLLNSLFYHICDYQPGEVYRRKLDGEFVYEDRSTERFSSDKTEKRSSQDSAAVVDNKHHAMLFKLKTDTVEEGFTDSFSKGSWTPHVTTTSWWNTQSNHERYDQNTKYNEPRSGRSQSEPPVECWENRDLGPN